MFYKFSQTPNEKYLSNISKRVIKRVFLSTSVSGIFSPDKCFLSLLNIATPSFNKILFDMLSIFCHVGLVLVNNEFLNPKTI